MTGPIPESLPRAALVTGGAQRLGRAIALTLAEAGFDVAIHYRDSGEAAAETLDAIKALGRRATMVRADLSREAEVAEMVAKAAASLGPLGVLVNNASRFERDEWNDVTRESWDAHMETNLRAPFLLSQMFARQVPAGREGVIINMLDQRVWSPTGHFMSYSLSKMGLWALTQSLALALAPRIRVNAIGPGPALPSPRQTAEQFAHQAASVPLGRPTGAAEIARAVIALLTLPSMTGQMIALDGGQHLQWGPVPGEAAPE